MPFEILPSTEIAHRSNFADLCNARKLFRAVEVGTDLGNFAREFLNRWRGEMLYLIDPHESYRHMPWPRDSDRFQAISGLIHAGHHGRFRLLPVHSTEAPRLLGDRAVEFVYIDGAHDYESVQTDIQIWWNKLYPVGPTILAGHDFDDDHYEVKQAVTDFARELELKVRHTIEGDGPTSWYIYRNEPEELLRMFA